MIEKKDRRKDTRRYKSGESTQNDGTGGTEVSRSECHVSGRKSTLRNKLSTGVKLRIERLNWWTEKNDIA